MRRFAFLFAALLVIGVGLSCCSTVSLPVVVRRLFGFSYENFDAKTMEVDAYPVRAASRRLLKPLGFVRLTRVLPTPSLPSAFSSSSSSASSLTP